MFWRGGLAMVRPRSWTWIRHRCLWSCCCCCSLHFNPCPRRTQQGVQGKDVVEGWWWWAGLGHGARKERTQKFSLHTTSCLQYHLMAIDPSARHSLRAHTPPTHPCTGRACAPSRASGRGLWACCGCWASPRSPLSDQLPCQEQLQHAQEARSRSRRRVLPYH